MEIMEDNTSLGKKNNNLEVGYVWAPYIMTNSTPIVVDDYSDLIEKIKNEVIQENRDRSIDSILEGKEYQPMKVEDHPDYPSIKSRYNVKNINPNRYGIKTFYKKFGN